MVLVVLGVDALDPELVDPSSHANLVLEGHQSIDTIDSHAGEPSTHELWPTIITGLSPEEHGLQLEDGVAWDNPILRYGSAIADVAMPDSVQTRLGAWLLTNTSEDAFRVPATYYADNDVSTVFDGRKAKAIGVPNYVVDPDTEDREHSLRRHLGTLFERDPDATGGHRSSDPYKFYEQCLEMVMVRIARARRALRGGRHELVFAYTSGLDLVGHVTHDLPDLQRSAYDELDGFVGELREDLRDSDELVLVSDHGLQDGVHTHEAMIAATDADLVDDVESVLDIRESLENELDSRNHAREVERGELVDDDGVREQLEDLGYM